MSLMRKLFLFISIPVVLLTGVAVAVPPTPRSQISLLYSKLDKDARLRSAPDPRLILMGGSNLSFGLDSRILEEELGVHPVNTSIQATIGTEFLMDTLIEEVRPGDVLVLSAEYSQFFGRNAYGGEELLRLVMDVDRGLIQYLDYNQWRNIVRYFPEYALSKLNPREYFLDENPETGIYQRASFNEYGDAYIHWGHDHSDFPPYDRISGELNAQLFDSLKTFEKAVAEKGGRFLITFPCLQEATYKVMKDQIQLVYQTLGDYQFELLGTPKRYRMDELLMYNTPYHLNRIGVEYRSALLVEDLRAAGVGGPD